MSTTKRGLGVFKAVATGADGIINFDNVASAKIKDTSWYYLKKTEAPAGFHTAPGYYMLKFFMPEISR
ncbi:MAG: hypothetical protein LBP35_05480 [Candidatus Ancillula trichonymphae]|nr:hypothetical protein [Candidatus Ancillula trichonymphae]